MESCAFEMPIKGKNAIYPFTLHQHKRDAIVKTDTLIRKFAEKLQCLDFISPIWPADCESLRGIEILCPLNGEVVSCAPTQQRERFIEHKIAGYAGFAVRTQFLPSRHGAVMMLIIAEVACQEGTGVDENHVSSPYRYRS